MSEITKIPSCRLPETYCYPYGLSGTLWGGDILHPERHRAVGKESGGTAHTERSDNTLRQMCPVTVGKTLSSGRNMAMHGKRVRIFIDCYSFPISFMEKIC